ncbi:hypothetical protein SAMN04487857_112123 [Pseudomonas sp. ok272]|uniref:protein DnrP n=1 Tax=unclassified Pseudomonas TaxID=196821 RepID=UPI0008D6C429|nr:MULTISPECIES: protein DnrP [unclassified Pseudomonas]SEN25393.1 hypothetical protein SAMN04487857_112123 [Pseudomonas sp. ok272]SFN16409.1 hypothetical protein SAMN04487858_113123 [Pseudomonas sp. ok602]
MNTLPVCLYCQKTNPSKQAECLQCSMPLPVMAERAQARRLRRFRWFCIGLTIFCIAMFFGLPRGIS